MDILSNFSERLIELMEEHDLNPESLGKVMKVDPTTIRYWKKPEKNIYISNLIKVADYFKCSLDFLCKRSETYLDYTPKKCPTFMKWLPTIIKENGKTTYRVFKDTRIKSSYFALWRKGSEPLLSSLGELADYLDCTLDRLVGRDR